MENRRMRFTGSRSKTSRRATVTRSTSMAKSLVPGMVRAAPQAGDEPIERRGRLGLTLLEGGADDGGEVADVFGDEEIVLHEALDRGQAAVAAVAEPSAMMRW